MKLSKDKKYYYILLLLSISFIFILNGCKKDANKNQYGFQIPIDNFYWAMTDEDVGKIADIEDADVTTLGENTENFIIKQMINPQKLFGYNVIVTLSFEDGSVNYGVNSDILEKVSFTFSDIDYSTLKNNINKTLEVQGNTLTNEQGVCTTWLSKDVLGDIKSSTLSKRLNDFWALSYNDELTEEQIKYLHDDDQAINYITLVVSGENDTATLNYYGSNAVLINLLSQNKSK